MEQQRKWTHAIKNIKLSLNRPCLYPFNSSQLATAGVGARSEYMPTVANQNNQENKKTFRKTKKMQSNASNDHRGPLRFLIEILLIIELRFFDLFDPLDPS